ncbi:MAG: 1-acyl-sn-glycerol-3-phosphate acyltransferase [Deltaproteobacteria bacterium]|nr:1-acyl-sn-glycerol-3-phosphate acyltransferase [Deltaproteobacteria bacterium]MBW2497530.1 1-acyl-sn-glycerol-3-phosphate acyltransferase [Deltaproteobacteria bacterium]
MTSPGVDPAWVRHHARQRMASLILAPIWISIAVVLLYFHYRYRIAEVRALRKRYRQIRAQSDAPMLVCANHLTLIDSMLVAWSMGSIGYWLRNFDELPWNTPERTNFGRNWAARTVIFIVKCIPIRRGGAREDVGVVLERVKYLLQQGETALIFPEAGRSRSGRVEENAAAWGVGRIVGSVPHCRVLCVYLRGRQQETWSDYPARGDVIDVSMACIEPKSDARGVRRSRDVAQQIVRKLMCMEEEVLDARQ